MLDFGNYLLGVAYLATLLTFTTLGCGQLRERLLPGWVGPPAWLATTVLALALLLWVAELLGTLGLLEAWPYLIAVAALGLALRYGVAEGDASPAGGRGGGGLIPTLIGLAVAAAAIVLFAADVKLRLGTGMTGFDSTWYHGPFAAGFFQTGNTWDLHHIAPQFLAWFYPANSELFHAMGMLAFDRDIVSPLLNLGWFLGCLVAVWCIGRPFGVAPFSLALGAFVLSVPTFNDQAGEARNDIVGTFFLLAAVALALNGGLEKARRLSSGTLIVSGLAVGLAAGTKLNFLLPAAVFVGGLAVIAPRGRRWRALAAAGLPALAGGGYWYLRNLIHAGNPLPWIDGLGPISLPAPDQALGGRDAHSVLGYLTDSAVWADWLLPGLRDGLTILWPLLIAAALTGLLLPLRCWLSLNNRDNQQRKLEFGVLGVAGTTGLAVVLAWLIAPTSASGPEGMPRGFESGLRYLAPALVLGLALLPVASPLRERLRSRFPPTPADGTKTSTWSTFSSRRSSAPADGPIPSGISTVSSRRRAWVVLALALVGAGYFTQRHYLENRYSDPGFTTPGLNAAFAWARDISGARIATTSTRQYPLFGTDLSNEVQFIGIEQPHGGFTAPTTCRTWRRLLNEGDYDYVVASFDRTAAGKEKYPPSATWTSDQNATLVLHKLPTKVFRLTGTLDPSSCGL